MSKKDSLVGPNCLVAWAYRRNGPFKGGGGFASFKGDETRADEAFTMPTNANGADISALLKAVLPMTLARMADLRAGKDAKPDDAAINETLSKLPRDPDEKL